MEFCGSDSHCFAPMCSQTAHLVSPIQNKPSNLFQVGFPTDQNFSYLAWIKYAFPWTEFCNLVVSENHLRLVKYERWISAVYTQQLSLTIKGI